MPTPKHFREQAQLECRGSKKKFLVLIGAHRFDWVRLGLIGRSGRGRKVGIWTGYLYRRDPERPAEKTGKERDGGIDTSSLIPLPETWQSATSGDGVGMEWGATPHPGPLLG